MGQLVLVLVMGIDLDRFLHTWPPNAVLLAGAGAGAGASPPCGRTNKARKAPSHATLIYAASF